MASRRVAKPTRELWRVFGPTAVLAIIGFHSGEDGVMKRFFQEGKRRGAWRLLHKKPVAPASREVKRNVRARSARLRAAVRLRAARMQPGAASPGGGR